MEKPKNIVLELCMYSGNAFFQPGFLNCCLTRRSLEPKKFCETWLARRKIHIANQKRRKEQKNYGNVFGLRKLEYLKHQIIKS